MCLTALDDIKSVTGGVISGVSRSAPLSDEHRYNIALIINELLANSFEHARPTPANPVFVQAELSGAVLRIRRHGTVEPDLPTRSRTRKLRMTPHCSRNAEGASDW